MRAASQQNNGGNKGRHQQGPSESMRPAIKNVFVSLLGINVVVCFFGMFDWLLKLSNLSWIPSEFDNISYAFLVVLNVFMLLMIKIFIRNEE